MAQVVPQAASADRHDHIVDRGTKGRLDELHRVEGHLHVLEQPVWGQRCIERCARSLKQRRGAHTVAIVMLHRSKAADRGARHLGQPPGLLNKRTDGAEGEHGFRRRTLRPPDVVWLVRRVARRGLKVEHMNHEFRARHAVDGGVMHL